MTTTLLAAVPQKAVAGVIFAGVLLAWIVYLIAENKKTTTSNVDSFLNAPNRKAAPDDEVYEGPRLDRFLGWALIGITVMAFALPFYWLGERGRQEGSIRGFDRRSVKRGLSNYEKGFQCNNCHGPDGGGGVASWTILQYKADGTKDIDPKTNKQRLKTVTWAAPRINDVGLRYKENQIRNVLIYGRGSNKPMPAWGLKGGGPANEQQIDDLVNLLKSWSIKGNEEAHQAYLAEWKISRDVDKAYDAAFLVAKTARQKESADKLIEARETAKRNLARLENKTDAGSIEMLTAALAKAEASKQEGPIQAAKRALDSATKLLEDSKATLAKSDGQILFEQNCARCHTSGWSYGEPKDAGGGFYGKKLSEASLKLQFPEAVTQHDFIKNGADEGKAYGTGGVGNYSGGGMPYFANVLDDKQIDAIVTYERGLGK